MIGAEEHQVFAHATMQMYKRKTVGRIEKSVKSVGLSFKKEGNR